MGDKVRAKLRVLLNYWIENNEKHSQEFREWVDQAKALGEVEVGAELLQAAQEMDKATKSLSRALKKLGE